MTTSAETDVESARKLAVVTNAGRFDLVVPILHPLSEALSSIGLEFEPGRHVILNQSGHEVDPETRAFDLEDGALLCVVDLSQRLGARGQQRGTEMATDRQNLPPSIWWLLGIAALMVTGGILTQLNGLEDSRTPLLRLVFAGFLGVSAAAIAGLWMRRAGMALSVSAATLFAPGLLAFAAGSLTTPNLYKAPHLAVALGLCASATVFVFVAILAAARWQRSLASTTATVLLVFAGIWGLTLAIDWNATAATAICFALVLPVIRGIPATVLNLPEGYTIEYRALMSNRWTVRGAVPQRPGDVTMDVIRPYVDESNSRVTAATVLMSITAVISTPVLIPIVVSGPRLPAIGAAVCIVLTILGLLLLPRHATSRSLRAVPRVAGGLAALLAVMVWGASLAPNHRVIWAGIALFAGLLALVVSIPFSRGTKSLTWSRVADLLEALAVAFAPAAALVAAGTIEFVRAMASG